MVKAIYTVDENMHKLSVSGHANYSEYGKDIVCAGISAIVQALIGWLEEKYYTADNISVDTRGGEVIVSCDGGEDVSAVFYMAYIGLEQISSVYPDHIHIDIIGLAD